MMREIHCPSCGRLLSVADEAAALESRCSGCGAVFVPAPAPSTAPPENVPIQDISLPDRSTQPEPPAGETTSRGWSYLVIVPQLLLAAVVLSLAATEGLL